MDINFKQNDHSVHPNIVIAVLLALSLACCIIYSREGEYGLLHNVQATFTSAFMPAKVISGAISSAEQGTSDMLSNATADATTLSGLKQQNEELRASVAQLEEYRQQAQRLQGLLNLRDTYNLQGVTASITARSSDAWNQIVSIDKGSDDGVRVGLPVIGSTGLVGQVVSTAGGSSEVRLLTDPQSGVAIMIQSNRTEGILRGSLEGLLYLEDVDQGAAVSVGDVVITSGIGGGYTQGIMIGTVVKVEQRNGDVRQIVVKQNESSTPLQEVLVATEGTANTTTQTTDEATSSSAASTASSSSSQTASNASDQDEEEE